MGFPSGVGSAAQYRPLQVRDYLAISIFWFGVSLYWAAFLTIVMQERVAEIVQDELKKGTAIFVLTAIGAFVSTVIELIAGPISDRCTSPFGRRRPFIFWGTLITLPFILLFMMTPASPNYFGWLVFHFVLIQLFLNWANGPYQAVIPDQVSPERHGLASAYMGAMTLLGNAIGLALAGLTLTQPPLLFTHLNHSQRLLILGFIFCGVLLTTMLWTVLGMKEVRWQPHRPEEKRITLAHMFDIRLKDHPDFALLIWSRFFFNLGFYTVTFFLDYYLRDSMGLKEKAPQHVFLLIELALITGLIGNWIAGKVADRYSKKRVLYLCNGVLGLAAFCFLFTHSLTGVYLLGALFGVAWGAFAAVDWAMASNLVPVREAGRYMAIWHIAMTVPQVIAPITGPLADQLNAYQLGLGWRIAFAFVPFYLLLGVLFLRPIRERVITQEGEKRVQL